MPAWGVAALLSIAYLAIDPPSADLAAQVYRSHLFDREGFVLWDNAWYGGHHMPGYSLLFPPLGAHLGPRVVGALSAVAAAVLFERIVSDRFVHGARAGALWFAAGTQVSLVTGRLAFALGLAVGLAAVLAALRRRHILATALGATTVLASPVAGLFLGMAAAAWLLVHRARAAMMLGAAVAAVLAFLAIAFPEGGTEPFVASAFWPALAGLVAVWVVLPARHRTLRAGVAIYALAMTASFLVDSPVGGNSTRLGAILAGPLVACALWGRNARTLALLALPLLYWQWNAPVRDWTRAAGDPSIEASYYQGLLGFLATREGTFRVEIPFTANHWEANRVARRFPLARGWERQLDVRHNRLFYEGDLTPGRYRAWLHENAIAYVALPDARLDYSARAEAALIRARPAFLQPVWRDAHWQVFAVASPARLADGAAVTRLGTDSVALRFPAPGRALLRVRWTPYWRVVHGSACVERAGGGWTRVRATRAGAVGLATRFAPGRIASDAPRCQIG